MRRDQVKTPALILDLDVLDANIATMVATAKKAGLSLRPHAKSHKSPDIARRLVAAGALGACCATIGEAEALAAAGIPGLLVTSPLATVGHAGAARRASLAPRQHHGRRRQPAQCRRTRRHRGTGRCHARCHRRARCRHRPHRLCRSARCDRIGAPGRRLAVIALCRRPGLLGSYPAGHAV